MENIYPTYKLGPEFSQKLDAFVEQFISSGYETFSAEFNNIEDFVKRANCDKSKRTDTNLRQSPKVKYLLELVSFKIYDEISLDKN